MHWATGKIIVAFLVAGLTAGPWASTASADNVGIVGKKLILIDKYAKADKAKAVFVSKDTTADAIHNGAEGGMPVSNLHGQAGICVTGTGNRALFDLPAPWVANKESVSKYVNKTAAPGGPGAKVVVIKPGKVLKLVAKNLGDGDSAPGNDSASDLNLNDPPGTCAVGEGETIEVEVALVDDFLLTTHRMCARFTVEVAKSIAGDTGCKVISKSSVPGSCGWCLPI